MFMSQINIFAGKVQDFHNGCKERKVIVMNELKDLDEKSLNKALWEAVEMRSGYLIEMIREEMNERNKYQ